MCIILYMLKRKELLIKKKSCIIFPSSSLTQKWKKAKEKACGVFQDGPSIE